MADTIMFAVADLREMKKLLCDLRFIQAAALVASEMNEDKKPIEYMKRISRLEKLIELELKRNLS